MPTRDANRKVWESYDWKRGGEEWSAAWGSARAQWWGCLFPRISRFLPAGTVLEIAPGAGRFSQFLAPLSRRLILVDIAQSSVDLCRRRFHGLAHVECHLNDGHSLPFVADGEVDFAFSFDSLVHVDMATLSGYVEELGRVLADDGVAFLHHSNFGAHVDPETGEPRVPNRHWRDEGVSAERVREEASRRGLRALVQELVNWGAEETLVDCLTLLTRPGSRHAADLRVALNPRFMEEAVGVARLFALWAPDGPHYDRVVGRAAPRPGRVVDDAAAPSG